MFSSLPLKGGAVGCGERVAATQKALEALVHLHGKGNGPSSPAEVWAAWARQAADRPDITGHVGRPAAGIEF